MAKLTDENRKRLEAAMAHLGVAKELLIAASYRSLAGAVSAVEDDIELVHTLDAQDGLASANPATKERA